MGKRKGGAKNYPFNKLGIKEPKENPFGLKEERLGGFKLEEGFPNPNRVPKEVNVGKPFPKRNGLKGGTYLNPKPWEVIFRQ